MGKDKKIFQRIFKEDAEEAGLDMKKYYRNRRKGLYPFFSSEDEVVWLHRKEFRAVSAIKRDVSLKKSKRKHKKNHSKKSDDALDFSDLLSQKGLKGATVILGSMLLAYILLKIFLLV